MAFLPAWLEQRGSELQLSRLPMNLAMLTAADAARAVRPHLPIKSILEKVKDDLEPQTGRP